MKIDATVSNDHRRRLQVAFKVGAMYYLNEVTYDDVGHDKTPSRNRTINSFTDSQCDTNFRFQKKHLTELVNLLKLDGICTLSNGITMPGEEILLRGLYELANAHTKNKVADEFGRDGTAQTRAFTYFIKHMINNFEDLVVNKNPDSDNLSWWFRNGFIAESADLIEMKTGVSLSDDEKPALFIDCNCLPSCRVGGGPADDGANSARWDPNIQRAFYNSWKSVDGLKHQTSDIAHGFTVDMHGPTSLRKHDLTLFRESDINGRLKDFQLHLLLQYIIFGDSAYVKLCHTRSYFKHGGQHEIKWNKRMKRVRVSIEWNYGSTAALFPYVCNEKKLKILQNCELVSNVYKVAIIFKNIHIGYYGCQSSNYFDVAIRPDFVKHYLMKIDFDD